MINAIIPGMILIHKITHIICVVVFVDKFHVHFLDFLTNCSAYNKESKSNFQFLADHYYGLISR